MALLKSIEAKHSSGKVANSNFYIFFSFILLPVLTKKYLFCYHFYIVISSTLVSGTDTTIGKITTQFEKVIDLGKEIITTLFGLLNTCKFDGSNVGKRQWKTVVFVL